MCRLHGLSHHSQVVAQCVQVRLVPELGGEGFQGVLNIGNEDLRRHLKEQLVGVAGLLAEQDNSPSDRSAGVADLTERVELGAFMDAALTLAVAVNPPENVHPELAAL